MSIPQLEPTMATELTRKRRGNSRYGKSTNPRRVAENEAMAKLRMLRTSPQKLNLVAAMIRGKKLIEHLPT